MTFEQFERKRYNEILNRLQSEIKDLEEENAELNRVICKLTRRKKRDE